MWRQSVRSALSPGSDQMTALDTDWIDDDHWRGGHQERVAIRRCFGDTLCCQVAAGPGDTLDHDGLAPIRGELVSDQARNNIGGTTRGEPKEIGSALPGSWVVQARWLQRRWPR